VREHVCDATKAFHVHALSAADLADWFGSAAVPVDRMPDPPWE
jgi:hypothetical protein